MTQDPARGRIRGRLGRWRLVSPTGADVVSLRQLDPKERLRVIAPSLFTLGNMSAGFASVLLSFRGHVHIAAALLGMSIVFDIADGAVARLVGATSPFGVQLDSMADLISFGVAPAVLVHTWGLAQWPVLSWVFAFFWLLCAAFRLARFNVTVDPLADKRYFIGLPSPGAAAVPIATVFALQSLRHGPWLFFPLAVSVLPALLMVTTVRFRSFRTLLTIHRGPRWRMMAALLVLVLAVIFIPRAIGVVLAYGYVLTAPLGAMTASWRRRMFGDDAVAPPRTKLPSVFLPTDTDPGELVEPD